MMSEPDFISEARIAILGLGLMGGSLALALRGRCQALSACDPDLGTVSLARQRGVVDEVSPDPAEVLSRADAVILAAPLNAIFRLIDDLPSWHPGSAIVLDLGSTKSRVVEALRSLPPRFDPLGGHPMCGKEVAGLANAEASIFQGATFAFTPLERTSTQARAFAEGLARVIGSRPVWLDPATHDRWAAATSHLPYLLAAALSLATPAEAAALVGPGFRSTSRVAATPAATMLDVLLTNRENILESLAGFRRHLEDLEGKLAAGETAALKQALDRSAMRQRELVKG
jgi:prephenate dehydrogenase